MRSQNDDAVVILRAVRSFASHGARLKYATKAYFNELLGAENLSIFEAFNRQKQCRHALMLYNIHDQYIGRSLDLYGEFSEGEVEAFRQIVHPGQLVVEIGANIGAHTVFLAQHVGPTGLVLAFEPQRLVFQTLCANLALNNIPNVMAYRQALGSTAGTIKVPELPYNRETNFGGLGLGEFEFGEDVPLATLDSFGLTRCSLIKVDVEGMEKDVLAGAVETIARFKPVLYVENDRPERSAELIRYIDSLGYSMYWHLPYYFSAGNFFNNADNVFPGIVSMNMLCVHSSVSQQVAGLQPVEVPAGDACAVVTARSVSSHDRTQGFRMSNWEFWIDVGGTFTDSFARRPDGTLAHYKVLSSGVIKGAVGPGSGGRDDSRCGAARSR